MTSLRDSMSQGKPAVGTWNTVANPLITETLAVSGLDFVLIDMEHGPFDIKNVSNYCNACTKHNATPIVRIPKDSDWMALQALDQGAKGVIVPHVESQKQCQDFVDSLKYYPEGKRGFSPFTPAGSFGSTPIDEFVEKSNNETITAIIIESLKGLKNIDSILEVKGLDVVFFGSFDLSQALGIPGDTRNEKVLGEIKAATAKVIESGKVAGGYLAQNADDLKWALELGFKFLVYNVDTNILRTKIANDLSEFRNQL